MATKKKESASNYGKLYVPMNDVVGKRKMLLQSIKDALVLQEEYEQLIAIRRQKAQVLQDIKDGMDDLNKSYMKYKKAFPNIKNVLSHTQREILELEGHISAIKKHIKSDEQQIETLEALDDRVRATAEKKPLEEVKKKPAKEQKIKRASATKGKSTKANKMDRIKHNLKVIEGKLGDL